MQRQYILIFVSVFVVAVILIGGVLWFLPTNQPVENKSEESAIPTVVVDQATKDRIIAELQKMNASSTISEKEKTAIINSIQQQNQATSSGANLDEITKQNIIKSINPHYPN